MRTKHLRLFAANPTRNPTQPQTAQMQTFAVMKIKIDKMATETKSEGKQVALINGLFALIVAIISLIGGYLLKDPIDKVLFKPHCQVGGVWKPHGDVMVYCQVTKFDDDDDFTIRITGSLVGGSDYAINGVGKMKGSTGEFDGERIVTDKKQRTTSEKVKGKIGLQGCDGLGVVLNFESNWSRNYSFIREVPNTIGIDKESEN